MAIVYTIAYINQTIALARWNLGITGKALAIFDAIFGIEYVEILREQVIEVSNKKEDGKYLLTTSDTETIRKYIVVPVDTDEEDDWYQEAKRLAGNNEALFEALKPRGRVIRQLRLSSSENDETRILIVYLKTQNSREVEEVVNSYFKNEFYNNYRAARREARKTDKIVFTPSL
ncbi:hypothetical protein IJ798_00160 [Candidatus Saccharibacteria bacterium]|nr:hypothetical protein [Candidatus Saccharibacteria bacterium]